MLFSEGIAQLSLEVSKTPQDTETNAKIKSALNYAKIEVGKSYLWKELKRTSEIVLIPNYTDGTVSIINGSHTVTGNGTAWTAAMAGRFFQHSKTGYWYKIASVDVTNQNLILESPIIESSDAGLTHKVWKRYYRVNSDIRMVLPDEGDSTLPVPFSVEGYDLTVNPYTDGTVIATQDSDILTGVGTSFFGSIFPGDIVTIQGTNYRVKSVDSNTQLHMVNKAIAAWAGAYSVLSPNPYQADFASSPSSPIGYGNPGQYDICTAPATNTLLRYFYLRDLYPMVNDSDSTELSVKFDRCILDFAKAEFLRANNSPAWAQELQVAQLRLEKLKMDSSLVHKPYRTFPPLVVRGNGRGQNQTIVNL